MTTKGAYELLGILQQDETLARAYSKLIISVLRDDIAPILVPGHGRRNTSTKVTITYAEACALSGMTPVSIRRLVYKNHVAGTKGHLDRESFINYILSFSRLATRQYLLDRLDEEERNAQKTS
jgi:hypothetical protein